MQPSDIAKLAADFALGSVTAGFISEQYGPGILGEVLGIVGGSAVAGIVSKPVSNLMDSTGVSNLIDDVGGLFGDLF